MQTNFTVCKIIMCGIIMLNDNHIVLYYHDELNSNMITDNDILNERFNDNVQNNNRLNNNNSDKDNYDMVKSKCL